MGLELLPKRPPPPLPPPLANGLPDAGPFPNVDWPNEEPKVGTPAEPKPPPDEPPLELFPNRLFEEVGAAANALAENAPKAPGVEDIPGALLPLIAIPAPEPNKDVVDVEDEF